MHGNEDNEGRDREGTKHGNGGNVSDFSLNLHFDMKHNIITTKIVILPAFDLDHNFDR